MIIFEDKEDCTGCSLCEVICPKKAITMTKDQNGFRYPVINQEICIDCGLCKKQCPQNSENLRHPIKCYGAFIKDEYIRENSSSGGVFWSLVKYIINENGVVFGVRFDNQWNAVFDFAESEEDCIPFRMSKYVEADNLNLINSVRSFINAGRKVLVVATPCQIASFRQLYPKGHENLTLVDIVCNSVPGPKIWNGFIDLIEKNYGQIISINMRAKIKNWEYSSYVIKTSTDTLIDRETIHPNLLCNSYRSLFGSHLSVRLSCFNCKYKSVNRISDITIGDFWNVDKIFPKANDHKGISLLMINTDHGKAVISQLDNITLKEVSLPDVELFNVIPLSNISVPQKYNSFWYDFNTHGYQFVAKKYTRYGLYNNIKSKIGQSLRKIINR